MNPQYSSSAGHPVLPDDRGGRRVVFGARRPKQPVSGESCRRPQGDLSKDLAGVVVTPVIDVHCREGNACVQSCHGSLSVPQGGGHGPKMNPEMPKMFNVPMFQK